MTPLLMDAPADPTIKWLLIALAAGTMLYVVVRPAMKKKDPLGKKAQPSPFSSGRLAQQRDTERHMQNLLVELSEMARQITAQLDTRSQKLEILIHQADERISLLQQPTADRATPLVLSRPEMHPDVFKSADAFAPRDAELPPHPAAAVEVDVQHHDVYTMADQGHAAGEIARELGRPRGEVELILALRPRA